VGLGLQVCGAETDPAKYSSYTCFPVFVLNSSSFATSVALTGVCALVLTETVHRCLQHKSSQNLRNYCVPVSEVVSRQHLRSAARHQLLLIPRCRLGIAHSAAGPSLLLTRVRPSGTHWQMNCELTLVMGLRQL